MSLPVIDSQSLRPWEQVLAPYSLGYRIKLLTQLVEREFQERLEAYGLTPFHWVVLCCLWERDGLATSQIGEKLQQVGATMTGVIDRMEERGLVYRQRDPQDRRVYRVWLTETGQQLYQVLPAIATELREQVFQGISATDRQLFSDMVDVAIANLANQPLRETNT